MLRTALVATVMAAVALAPIAGQVPPLGGAQAYTADLTARRAKTMATIGSDTVLVMWSAPQRLYSDDVHYEYRQESNLLYLTGIDQPATILVLVPAAKSQKAHLFVRRGDPLRELWSGHTLTAEEVTVRSGIPQVHLQRDGRDLRMDLPITLKEALDGAKVEVPTLDGAVTLTVPPNSNSFRPKHCYRNCTNVIQKLMRALTTTILAA